MGFSKKRQWLSFSREATVASALLLQMGSNKKRKRLWLSLGAAVAPTHFKALQKGSNKKRKHYNARATQLETEARKARKLQISCESLQGVKKARTKTPTAAGTDPRMS